MSDGLRRDRRRRAFLAMSVVAMALVATAVTYRRRSRSPAHAWQYVEIEHANRSVALAGPHDGDQVAVALGSIDAGRVWFIDVPRGKRLYSVEFPSAGISCLDWSSPKGHVAVGRFDGVVSMIDVQSRKVMDILSTGHWITAIAISRDGKTLAAANIEGEVIFCNPQGAIDPRVRVLPQRIADDVALSSDGALAASCDVCGVLLWRTQDESCPVPVDWGTAVQRVEFSPDGQSLFYACAGETIHEWDIAEGCDRRSVMIPDTGIEGIAVSPDARFLVSSSMDEIVRLWDWRSGRELAQLGHRAFGLRIVGSGRYVVINHAAPSLLVWDLDRGRERNASTQPASSVR